MQRSSLDKKAEAELAAREAQRAFKREQLAIQEAAARAIQCHVRGMLARVTKNKLLGAVINGMSLDSEAKQRNRERRHLRDTRREILVIDWAQELRRAAIGADLEAVRKCIAQLPKDGLDAPSEAGMTALHYACVSGVEEVVIELLQAGADPRKRTHSTFTSLTPRVKVRTPLSSLFRTPTGCGFGVFRLSLRGVLSGVEGDQPGLSRQQDGALPHKHSGASHRADRRSCALSLISLVAKLSGGLLCWQSDKPNMLSPNSFHAGSARVSRRTSM